MAAACTCRPLLQELPSSVLLRVATFIDGMTTVRCFASLSTYLYRSLQHSLYVSVDETDISILASSTWIGENFGLKHPASCVDRLSLTYRKIVLPNHLLTLKRSLHNISVFHAQWNLSALRFASVNLTLADLFPGEIPASFQKLTKLYLTCQANPTCQRLCTRLTVHVYTSAMLNIFWFDFLVSTLLFGSKICHFRFASARQSRYGLITLLFCIDYSVCDSGLLHLGKIHDQHPFDGNESSYSKPDPGQ